MTDHRAEAERLHNLAGIDPKELAGIGALTQAVLYLGEQQRIANLQTERGLLFQKSGRTTGQVADAAHAQAVAYDSQITEGLGL